MSISGKLWNPNSNYNVFNLSFPGIFSFASSSLLPSILLLFLLFLLILLLLLPPLLLPWETGESPGVSPVMDRAAPLLFHVNQRSCRVSMSCYSSSVFSGLGVSLKGFDRLLFVGSEFEGLFRSNVSFFIYF